MKRLLTAVILLAIPGFWATSLADQSASSDNKERKMTINHVHVGVRDLPPAVAWIGKIWRAQPDFQNEQMASFRFGSFVLILDRSDQDSPATIGFLTENCDANYKEVVARGAVSLEAPADKPWGVRAAYLQGPGALKFELEQPLR